MKDVIQINRFLQSELTTRYLHEVTAVDAAVWLEQARLLMDSPNRPGKPLRDLLRNGKIDGAYRNGRYWFVRKVERLKAESPSPVLADILDNGLKVVFVGTAIGDKSAAKKHYYAHPTNCFYSVIHESGIVPVRPAPKEDIFLPRYGVGLTDIVKTLHTSNDKELGTDMLAASITYLIDRISNVNPAVVCFNGKTAYEAFAGRKSESCGLAPETIGQSSVFVVPSTSGRVSANKAFGVHTRLGWFQELSVLLKELRP